MSPLSAGLKQWLNRHVVEGRARSIIAPAYRMALKCQLQVHNPAFRSKQTSTADLAQVTALIKTFERPHRCQALIDSIERRCPGMPIVVVDDSRDPTRFRNVRNIHLPFDSGVSAGRNAGLEEVNTPFVLNLDDDFVLCRRTRLAAALEHMHARPEIDIMGGRVVDLPLYISHDFSRIGLLPTSATSVFPNGAVIGPFPVFDKVPNFFLAKTDAVRKVGWDPQLKRLDHADFFTRAKGILTTVYNDTLVTLHVRDPFASEYLGYRLDISRDIAYLGEKFPG